MKSRLSTKDPLPVILERHIIRSSTEGEKADDMFNAVINDYLLYLTSQGVHIPGPVKEAFMEDLKEELRELTIRKTFGAVRASVPLPSKGKRPIRRVA